MVSDGILSVSAASSNTCGVSLRIWMNEWRTLQRLSAAEGNSRMWGRWAQRRMAKVTLCLDCREEIGINISQDCTAVFVPDVCSIKLSCRCRFAEEIDLCFLFKGAHQAMLDYNRWTEDLCHVWTSSLHMQPVPLINRSLLITLSYIYSGLRVSRSLWLIFSHHVL